MTPSETQTRNEGERPNWPNSRPLSGAAFARVDSTVSCVFTRFRLKSPFALIPFYLAFRRVQRDSRSVSGLLHSVFLVEDLRTCCTLSFWIDDWSIVEFSRVRTHVHAANSAFRFTHRNDLKRHEIWSAQFRLWAVSCHNRCWEGSNLEDALAEELQRRQEVAEVSHSNGDE